VPQTTESQDEIFIDGVRLRRVFRRQARLWLWLGPLAAGLLLLLLAALVPRTYIGTTSVALQQSSGGNPAIALLTGGGGGSSKRYLGVLKSRTMAAAVERHVQLRQLYGGKVFRTEEDATEFLMKSVKPDDSATDGLLYIGVSLPGPPKLALHPSPSVAQVENASADAANAYALGLKEYFAVSDTDQGAVLLRGADTEVRQARARYNDAVSRSLAFTRGLGRTDPRTASAVSSALPSSSALSSSALSSSSLSSPLSSGSLAAPARAAGGTDSETASSALPGLYAELNRVQAELREIQAVRATGQTLIGGQLQDLAKVPTDDPLLADARGRVVQDQSAFNALSKTYESGNLAVIQAKARLDFDQANLNRQKEGIQERLTTPDVRSAEQIKGLYARESVLSSQIASAQQHLRVSRRLSGEAGRLQAEVEIQLDVLKATFSEAEKIKLNNASSLSRMSIIDAALPPKSGEPGLSKLAAVCLVLAFLAFLLAVIRDYLRPAPKPANAGPLSGGTNGHGMLSSDDPAHAAVPQETRKL